MIDGLKNRLLPFVVIAGLTVACEKVHQFPAPGKDVDPTEVKTVVKIDLKVKLAGFNIVTKSGDPIDPSKDSSSLYDRRFLVSIFANEYSDTLVDSYHFTREVSDTSDVIIDTKLHTRKYKIVAWMDYVRKGTDDDLYYMTSNGDALEAIHQPPASKYVGGSDFKDAQTFTSDIDLTPYAGQWYVDITIPAPLWRPVSKVTILANDMAEYASSIGFSGTLEEFADQIIVEFSYNGYYPTGFNAITGRLNDSEPGYGFKSYATYPYKFSEKDFTRVGFDYVFVNGESSSVTLTARIKTKSGQLINEVNNVVVPVTRGKETILIYKFFTKEYVPGIGIDPGFDGEFNIVVP